MEFSEIMKTLGIDIIIVLLLGGLIYWFRVLFIKAFPNFQFWFKYKILRSKYDENKVQVLLDYKQADLSIDQVQKLLLLKLGKSLNEVKEYCYIYKKMILLKGGNKK